MYIVTFYSFKGGVGRTMALANVGARLAQTGRKVLLVDFDLEAPGLGTYDFPKPKVESPGIVEFVSEFLQTNQAPKVNDYLYHSPGFGKEGGDLWIMPAGIQDENYASKFSKIDWQDLYANKNGFLLMEDLKQQWQKELGVDYVLLDSRTGHSDVAGICTRQLPNAVVLMMFPNIQNLIGLRKITSDIRRHEDSPEAAKIKQHFVISNVPDLDDEDQILENTFEQFRVQLEYEEASAIIHRYQSLALLNQDIFSVTRPRTRLAEEYRQLTDEVVLYNDDDREGAVNYLTRTLHLQRPSFGRERFKADEIESRISTLREKHGGDPEILFLLGRINHRSGSEEDALEHYKKAEKHGLNTSEMYSAMIRLQDQMDDADGALESIRKFLQCKDASYFEITHAAQTLSRISPAELGSIAESPALVSMEDEDQLFVAGRLGSMKGGFDASEKIIRRIREAGTDSVDHLRPGTTTLALGLMGGKRYEEAIEENVEALKQDLKPLERVGCIFNLAMARWAFEGTPDEDLFRKVVKLEDTKRKELNYVQCLSIAHFLIGNVKEAKSRLNKAKRILSKGPVRDFSAWSYSEVNQKVFKEHLLEMQEMIEGKEVRPRFME